MNMRRVTSRIMLSTWCDRSPSMWQCMPMAAPRVKAMSSMLNLATYWSNNSNSGLTVPESRCEKLGAADDTTIH